VSEDLAVSIDDPCLRGRHAVAGVNHARFAAHFAVLAAERPDVVDLQLERRERTARRHHRVDRAAKRRVEQRGGKAAVRNTQSVVNGVGGRAGERDTSFLDLNQTKAEQRHHRRRWNPAGNDHAKVLEAAD